MFFRLRSLTRLSFPLPVGLQCAFRKQATRSLAAYRRLSRIAAIPNRMKFAWAWSLVNSRCVHCSLQQKATIALPESLAVHLPVAKGTVQQRLNLSVGTPSNIAIVPFFDFFNHRDSVSTRLEFTEGALRLLVNENYYAEDQVFINYGPHDNVTLLCEYGFALPFGSNTNDAVHPTFDEIWSSNQANYSGRDKLLTEMGLPLDDGVKSSWPSVVIRADGPSYYLRLLLCAAETGSSVSFSFCELMSLSEDALAVDTRSYYRALCMKLSETAATSLRTVEQQLNAFVHPTTHVTDASALTAFLKELQLLLISRLELLQSAADF